MKFAHFTLGLLALVSPVAAAWSKEGQFLFDHRGLLAFHTGRPRFAMQEASPLEGGRELTRLSRS